MAASEVSAWGGFVVCLPACPGLLPACPGLLPAPGARPRQPATLLGFPSEQGIPVIPTARHLCDTRGSATVREPSPRLGPASRTVGCASCPSVCPQKGHCPLSPRVRGDMGEGGGRKGVTGRSNLRM